MIAGCLMCVRRAGFGVNVEVFPVTHFCPLRNSGRFAGICIVGCFLANLHWDVVFVPILRNWTILSCRMLSRDPRPYLNEKKNKIFFSFYYCNGERPSFSSLFFFFGLGNLLNF